LYKYVFKRFIGVVVMDTSFEKIDFNSCGVSPGNPGPSYLAGIDKCKKNSGVCINVL
jgi:hypothetical protein